MEDSGSVVDMKDTIFVCKATNEAKLSELLHKLNSTEVKLCSDAAKEFIKLLKGDCGGELLHLYVQSTKDFSELVGALKLRQGKAGMSYLLSLISVILSHPDGKYKPDNKKIIVISASLDKFARSFIEEYLDVIYKELNSKVGKRQKAALLLLSSIVRRGSGLASEVAKKFDFKLHGFSKLAEYKKRRNDKDRKHTTRKAFVGYAMSFLEMGKPGLLRWVLQQREMYSGVLRGLEIDDDETIIYVLSTLRDRILTEHSLVPPALRSVLFGSVVLEQLIAISGRENGGLSAEVAHGVLLMVCTDPCNGLMPDFNRHPTPLRGNPKRLLDLMKKLRAIEIVYHRDLLLAIVRGRMSFASAYMEEFPYNLEDFASLNWFSMVSLAANLVFSAVVSIPSGFLDSQSDDPPAFDSVDVQNIVKIISSRPLSRSVINKGLLHSDFLVKNGTLRLLLEALKLLDSFFRYISLFHNINERVQKWEALKQEIWNEAQTLLPDPQVLLTLLSSISSYSKTDEACLKRATDEDYFLLSSKRTKKLKTSTKNEDTNIIIGGIGPVLDYSLCGDDENIVDSQVSNASDSAVDFMNVISELWGSDLCAVPVPTSKEIESFFRSKLLDALNIYLLNMPTALEGSFDFFVNLLSNDSELPSNFLSSLLSLLVGFVRWSPSSGIPIRTPPLMYKHLQSFLSLLVLSPAGDKKIQAYNLARAAMASTGAFDQNLHELAVWFLFVPGYSIVNSCVEIHGTEKLKNLSAVVISFLCDAISTTGNHIFKYWNEARKRIYLLNEFKDISPDFSPFIICVLQKCMRLLSSESGTFSLLDKSMISLYVGTTLKSLLQTQVDTSLLAALIRSVLSEGLQDHGSVDLLCEWQPLKNLLIFTESILHQKTCSFLIFDEKDISLDDSFTRVLDDVRKNIGSGHDGELDGIIKRFSSAIMCTTSDELLRNFPTVMTMFQHLRIPLPLLSSLVCLNHSFIGGVSKLWPKVFFPGVEKAISMLNPQVAKDDAFAQEIVLNVECDASESAAAVAFGIFLSQAPFHVLFPAIMSSIDCGLAELSKIKELLIAKLSRCTSGFVVSYLRLILFWFYQIQLSYGSKPLATLKELTEICYFLMKHLLAQIFVLKPNSEDSISAGIIQEAVKTIFCHPAMKASFKYPLDSDEHCMDEDFGEEIFKGNLEVFLSYCQNKIHQTDSYFLDILATTFDYLSPFTGQLYVLEDGVRKRLVKAFKALMQRLYFQLMDNLDLFIKIQDFLPLLQSFYVLHSLLQFTSPFKLFDLAQLIFDKIEANGLTAQKSCGAFGVYIAFHIAGDAFKTLSAYLQQPVTRRSLFHALWEIEEKNLSVNLIDGAYYKVCKFAKNFEMDPAYTTCLLEAVSAVYRQKYVHCGLLDPLSMVLSRVILSTPVEILSDCIYSTSKAKAKFLSLLVDMSPLHLSVFGFLFLNILNNNCHLSGKMAEEDGKLLSNEDFLLLLPSAFSYLKSVFAKFEKQCYKRFMKIPSLYSNILLSEFCNWNSFVSGYVFQENYDDEFIPSSVEELINLVEVSLLGKAMHMLQYHFALSGNLKTKERLKMFRLILTSSDEQDELLDCDVDEIKFYSINQSLNLINRVTAKVSFCRMLLFPLDDKILSLPKEADANLKATSFEATANKEGQSRMHFMKILVGTWQHLVKKFLSVTDDSRGEKITDCLQLYRYLELFILKTIIELITKMRDALILLQDIPFLEQLMRSSLLYRFEDSTTLASLRTILTLLSGGRFSYDLYLLLLVSHSQFLSTIHSIRDSHSSQIGAFFRPMSSILKSLVIPLPNHKNDLQTSKPSLRVLEIAKLVRTLVQLKVGQSGGSSETNDGINLKDLYLLFLASYGATLSEIDLEIYNIIHYIECMDKSISDDLSQRDYLWGSAALKIRKERALDQESSSYIMADEEALEEHRRSQFREILPVDPMMCVATVLHFPFNRIVNDEGLLSNRFEPENLMNFHLTSSSEVDNKQRLYDPIFILRFSIHVLSEDYIEPLEFAGLGLLAITFMSISSPGLGMRKLGYECLTWYRNALERCGKKKDTMQLQLLLTYIQNGIKEPWQQIPSLIAFFAAESSFILLDPSNDNYSTLTKHLLHSSKVNMGQIPMFDTLFWNSTGNFRAERLWMLRLACAGLNLGSDAKIFKNGFILKTLLSFYCTPHADDESKELILEILKKSVKFSDMKAHLVTDCGLLPWLSHMLQISCVMLDKKERSFSSLQLIMAIEVVVDIISSRDIIEWLQKNGLEHLMDVSSHLFKLLVGGLKFNKENAWLINSVLQIMMSTLMISQRREIHQPHFSPSFEGLFQIYQVLGSCEYDTSGSSPSAELGLQVLLMSIPPIDIFDTNREKLSSFIVWAVSTALKSESKKNSNFRRSRSSLMFVSAETPYEETLISKLLRWLVAAVILRKLSWKFNDANSKFLKRCSAKSFSAKSLQFFLEYIENGSGKGINFEFDGEELIAETIFYLQQLIELDGALFSSVVCALRLLLSSGSSKHTDYKQGYQTALVSLSSNIGCPPEAKSDWRWRFEQSWEHGSFYLSNSKKMEEYHACQTLMVIISNILGNKPSDSQVLSYEEVQNSDAFEWERTVLEPDDI